MAIPIPKRLFGSQQKRLCNMRPKRGQKCYLLVVLLWSIHPKLMYGSKHAGQVQFSADWSGIWVSLKLKKTHYFVFCCGQTFVPSIGSIVKAKLYGQTGSFLALLEISAILLNYLSYFLGWIAHIFMSKRSTKSKCPSTKKLSNIQVSFMGKNIVKKKISSLHWLQNGKSSDLGCPF